MNTSNDDDFNPRADNYAPLQATATAGEFGDFSSAFGSPPKNINPKEDEFADFTSAFDSSLSISQAHLQPQPQQPQVSLLGTTIPNIGNPNVMPALSTQIDTGFGGNQIFNTMAPQAVTNQHQQNIISSNNNSSKCTYVNCRTLLKILSFHVIN